MDFSFDLFAQLLKSQFNFTHFFLHFGGLAFAVICLLSKFAVVVLKFFNFGLLIEDDLLVVLVKCFVIVLDLNFLFKLRLHFIHVLLIVVHLKLECSYLLCFGAQLLI